MWLSRHYKQKEKRNGKNSYTITENSTKNQSDPIKKGTSNKNSIKKVDMKEMQCYYCQKYIHYARDCYFNKYLSAKDKKETQYAHA